MKKLSLTILIAAAITLAVAPACLAATITISGTVYSDEGSTPLASQTVRVAVNGSDFTTTAESAVTTGTYSIASVPVTTGTIITVYLEEETADAVTVTVTDGNNMSNIDLYQDYLITRHDNSASLTNANLTTAIVSGENDITNIYNTDDADGLTVASGKELFVATVGTYAPGAVSITTPTLDVRGTCTQTTGTILITSNYQQASGTFNGGTASIDLNDASFTLDGGTFTNSSAGMFVERNFTINGGTYTNSRKVTFDGSDTADDSTITYTGGGTIPGTVDFNKTNVGAAVTIAAGTTVNLGASPNNVAYGGILNNGTMSVASGAWTIEVSDEELVTNGTISHQTGYGWDINRQNAGSGRGGLDINASGIVNFSGTALSIEGNFTHDGTFNSAGKVITFDGTSDSDDTVINGSQNIEGGVTINKTHATSDTTLSSDFTIQGSFVRTNGPITDPASPYTLIVQGHTQIYTTDTSGGANLTYEIGGGSSQGLWLYAGDFDSILRINKTTAGIATFYTNWDNSTEDFIVTTGTVDFWGKTFDIGGNFVMETGSQVVSDSDAMNGSVFTVAGYTDLDGEADDKLTFNWNTLVDPAWTLTTTGTADLDYVSLVTSGTTDMTLSTTGSITASYVDTEHSDASGGTSPVDATDNCTDNDNNTNWDFGGTSRYWVNDSGNGLWNNPTNWSTTSGGTGGATVPSSTKNVYFDDQNEDACVIDANVNIASLTVTDGLYTSGTIDNATNDRAITVSGNVDFNDCGTLSMGNATWTIGGNFDCEDVATINENASMLDLTGTTKILTMPGGAWNNSVFYDVTITGSYTATSSSSILYLVNGRYLNVDGTLTADTGKELRVWSNSYIAIGASGELAGSSGTFTTGVTSTTDYTARFTNSGTISVGTFLYSLASNANVTIPAFNYGGALSIKNTNPNSATAKLGSGTLTVGGDLTMSHTTGGSTITLDASVKNNTINVGGDWDTSSRGAFTTGTSSVVFNATTTGKTIAANGSSFYDLTFNGSGGEWTFQDTQDIDGNMIATTGTIDFNGQTLAIAGNLEMGTGSAVVSDGDAMNAASITVGGYTDLDGESGDTLTFNWNSAIDPTWSLITTGTADLDYCSLVTAGTTDMTLSTTGSITASYVDTEHSDASGGTSPVDATDNCTNNANNTNWDFGGTDRYWLGTTSADPTVAANWALTDGGVGGASAPGANKHAYFTGNGDNACTLTAPWWLGNLTTLVGYTAKLDLDIHNLTMTDGGNVTLDQAGEFDCGTGSHSVTNGNLDIVSVTTFTPGQSSWTLNGTGALSTDGGQNRCYDLTFAVGSTYSVAGTLYVTHELNILGDVTVAASQKLSAYASCDCTFGANASISGDGTFAITDAGSAHGLVSFDGTASITTALFLWYVNWGQNGSVIAPGTYAPDVFRINHSRAVARICTLSADPYVFGGDVEIVMNAGGGSLTIANNSNDPDITVRGDVTLTETAGTLTYDAGTGTITLGNNATDGGTQAIDFGDETIEDIVINAPGDIKQFTGGWTADSFLATSGTVDFNGQTVVTSGNFEMGTGSAIISDGDAMNGATITVGGYTDLDGESGDTLTFNWNSAIDPTWSLTTTGTADLDYVSLVTSGTTDMTFVTTGTATASYVDVEHSDATGAGAAVDADDGTCTDNDNNTNWDFGAIISGTVYSDEGSTALAGQTVRVAIDGTNFGTTAESAATTGTYSIPNVTASAGDVITVYLEDEDADAVTVTVAATTGNDMSGIDLYQDYLITRHDNSGTLTNANLTTAIVSGENDITNIYTTYLSDNLVVASGKELFVSTVGAYGPGAASITTPTLDIRGTATQTSGTILITSNYQQASGIFTGGTATIDLNDASFTLDGGIFTNSTAGMFVERNFTINGGTYTNSRKVTFDGSDTADDSTITYTGGGTIPGTVDFNKTDVGAAVTIVAGTTVNLGASPNNVAYGGILNNGTMSVASGAWTIEVSDEELVTNGTISHQTGYGWDINRQNAGSGAGGLDINASGIVNFTGTALNIEGNFTHDGTFNSTGKTITFDGTSDNDDTVISGSQNIEGAVKINKTHATSDTTLSSDFTIQGNFVRTNGPITNPASPYTLTVQGHTQIFTTDTSGGANLTYELGGGNSRGLWLYAGDFDSILRINKTAGTSTFYTNWDNSTEDFIVTTGTVDFWGKDIDIGGNFVMETGSQVVSDSDAMNSVDFTVAGYTDLDGEADDKLTFNWDILVEPAWSLTTTGTADLDYVSLVTSGTADMTFVTTGAATASYVDVEHSDATGAGAPVDASDATCTDNSNNTNWNFSTASAIWFGTNF